MYRLLRFRMSSIRDKIKQERETRLSKINMDGILPVKTSNQIEKIRNIGIIAHIDAGKTTTTERMLYYAGALPSPGDIDDGTTTMDYMKQERERGITIRSAAISFNWNHHQINLIDTPGHVDFSGEVTRSLRVLDGAITILDGVKGVEAQTLKVWEHASRRSIPKLCYINKMDRIGASLSRTVDMIKGRMNVDPIVMQAPIGQGQNFRGVVNLITLQEYIFKGRYGEQVDLVDITKSHSHFKQYEKQRESIIDRIANYDQEVGQLYLNEQPVPSLNLLAALKRVLNNPKYQSKVCPIFIGSSYRNKGVQPLMDAVIDFLPSPTQRAPVHSVVDQKSIRKPIKEQPLAAYTFKVIYDTEKGPLAYTRIYSGELKKTTVLLNTNKVAIEKIAQIFRVRANQYIPVDSVTAGDIVAISGLYSTNAGETLVTNGEEKFMLQKLQLPSAIFTMPFELQSRRDEKQFKAAMMMATMEDNSLLYKEQAETGQFLVSGLGELHLQILRDKLIEDGIKVKLGNLKINYKQTISEPIKQRLKVRNVLKNEDIEEFDIELAMVPLRKEDGHPKDYVTTSFIFEKTQQFDDNWKEFLRRKQLVARKGKKEAEQADETQQNTSIQRTIKRSIRNPMPIEPLYSSVEDQEELVQVDMDAQMAKEPEVEEDDDEQNQNDNENEDEDEDEEGEGDDKKQGKQNQPLYHINTLPFETLYDLVEGCKNSMLSGKRNFPMTGVELQIGFGTYRKNNFSKSVMNRSCSKLVRQMIQKAVVLEPIMEFALEGEAVMIEIIITDIIQRRGIIDEQLEKSVTGKIPASSVKGWVKELRAMGLDVSMKFSHYEEIMGVDPDRIINDNS